MRAGGTGRRQAPGPESRRSRAAWVTRWSRSRRLVVRAAAARRSAYAASASPSSSCRWARTASSRGWSGSRGSTSATTASPAAGPLDHAHGDGLVERDDRVAGDPLEELVQRRDVRPVGGGCVGGSVVHGGDRGLELVLPHATGADRGVEHGHPLGDGGPVPAGAVLVGQRDEPAALVDPRRAARLDQQHQGEQPRRLGVVGHRTVHHPGQPDRLAGELHALTVVARRAGVPLVEDQVQHAQHARQPLDLVLGRRRLEPRARAPDASPSRG